MSAADDLLARRALGWGAAAPLVGASDIGRDLALAHRPGGGLDLACVVGVSNLAQDLAVALTTARGADPFNTDFGFDGMTAFTEELSPAMASARIRASVAKTVARDARVRSVTAIEVDDAASAPDQRALSLRVTVDTIASSGASLAVVLGL